MDGKWVGEHAGRWVGEHADEQMDKRAGWSVKVDRLAVEKRKHERMVGPVYRRAGGILVVQAHRWLADGWVSRRWA